MDFGGLCKALLFLVVNLSKYKRMQITLTSKNLSAMVMRPVGIKQAVNTDKKRRVLYPYFIILGFDGYN